VHEGEEVLIVHGIWLPRLTARPKFRTCTFVASLP
jgi:hypothetical protein